MTSSTDSARKETKPPRQAYEAPRLAPLGSVADLTLGTLQTAMPENGGSGNSQV